MTGHYEANIMINLEFNTYFWRNIPIMLGSLTDFIPTIFVVIHLFVLIQLLVNLDYPSPQISFFQVSLSYSICLHWRSPSLHRLVWSYAYVAEIPRIQMLILTGKAIERETITAVEVIPDTESQHRVWEKYKNGITYQWWEF